MNRFISILISICLGLNLMAQNPDSAPQTTHAEASSNTGKDILNELIEIRKIQEANRAERDSIRHVRFQSSSQQKIDSADIIRNEYGAMLKIADNTAFDTKAQIAWWVAIIALVVSAVSMYYAIITYRMQEKTEINTKKAEENTKKAEQNTKRVSQEAQRKLLNDLLRHLYRNYVITYTMRTKMADINYNGYPSEEHFEKLKIPMENIHLDAFYGEDQKFQDMHVLYLNMRNYNEEINVALKHIVNPVLTRETKDEDFDTLEFKVSYLTGRIVDTIRRIWGNDSRFMEEMRQAINLSLSGTTNSTNNTDVPGSGDFTHLTIEQLKNTCYTKIYSDQELENFCKVFNNDVHEERKKNIRGGWKIRMILYNS